MLNHHMKLAKLDSTQKIRSNDTKFVNIDTVFIIKWYFYDLHVPACLACKQTCLYMLTYCHIINPSLIPHRRTTPSLYDCTGCLPNPSPTPVQVQLKPCLTNTSAKGPTQTNRKPKEPSTRQLKQTTMMTTRTSQATHKKQRMGWRTTMTRTRTTPQCQEAVDEGVP